MNELTQLNSVAGHLAKPNGIGPWPATIVIQEWWGLDAQTKSIADRFAREGYLAFAPDLYHNEIAQLRANLKAPVLGFFGDADVSIPAGTIEEFDKLLDEVNVEHELITYPNSSHAFFRDSDPSVYIPEASKDAWERTKKFFKKNLN